QTDCFQTFQAPHFLRRYVVAEREPGNGDDDSQGEDRQGNSQPEAVPTWWVGDIGGRAAGGHHEFRSRAENDGTRWRLAAPDFAQVYSAQVCFPFVSSQGPPSIAAFALDHEGSCRRWTNAAAPLFRDVRQVKLG